MNGNQGANRPRKEQDKKEGTYKSISRKISICNTPEFVGSYTKYT